MAAFFEEGKIMSLLPIISIASFTVAAWSAHQMTKAEPLWQWRFARFVALAMLGIIAAAAVWSY